MAGPPHFRLFDKDHDGHIDCVLQVPAMFWARRGYARDGVEHCSGRHVEAMPPELAALADEALALQAGNRFGIARLLDVDGDGRVDCVTHDGTLHYANDASCPEPLRSDAAPFTTAEQAAADHLLEVRREIRERWLAPLARD